MKRCVIMNTNKKTKDCEICGDSFEYTPNRKYCLECAKNPKQARSFYEKARRRINNHAGVNDAPKVKLCKHCSKSFATYYNASFCSVECETQYKIENAECTFCHVNLKSVGVELQVKNGRINGGVRFCSDECKEKYYATMVDYNRKKRGTIACEYCKKEFYPTNSKSYFCSRECYEKAREDARKKECKMCHTIFKADVNSTISYCETCARKIRLARQQKDAERIAAEKLKAEEKERKKLEEGIKKNGLCFYCNTPYAQCERMQTNFVYYPKGCKVEKGKVLECPCYTERKKKEKKKEG